MRRQTVSLSFLGFATLIGIGCGGAAPSSTPTPPPASGRRIFFASERTGNSNIYSINPDGSDLRQITNHPGHDGSPCVSRDGTKVVFSRFIPGSEDDNLAKRNIRFVVMNADGTGEVTLPAVPGVILPNEPRWSPDGNTIVYSAYRTSTATTDIYTMNANGTGIKLISNGPLIQGLVNFQGRNNPDFSPDGNRIVCTVFGGVQHKILVMSADGSNETVIAEANQARFPRWSPDGSKIVCQTRDGKGTLLVMNADGTGRRTLIEATSASTPSWSPDGAHVAFSVLDGSTFVLHTIRQDGSNLMRLASDIATATW